MPTNNKNVEAKNFKNMIKRAEKVMQTYDKTWRQSNAKIWYKCGGSVMSNMMKMWKESIVKYDEMWEQRNAKQMISKAK